MKKWILLERPDLAICPGRYCFNWADDGDKVDTSNKLYPSLGEALDSASLKEIEQGGCNCTLGVCRRYSNVCSDPDLYEPCEPPLKKAGLPTLYFCSPENLEEFDLNGYQVMVENLWEKNA